MDTAPRETHADFALKTMDAVYGGVLEPAHYNTIIDAMNAAFDTSLERGGDVAPVTSLMAAMRSHFATALRLFDMARPQAVSSLRDLLNAKPFAAMAVTEDGRAVALNAAATAMLGPVETVEDLPLHAEGLRRVREFLRGVSRTAMPDPVVVSGAHPADDRALVFVLEAIEPHVSFAGDEPSPSGRIVLVKSTETRLPDRLWRLMQTAFGLSASEQLVVRELAHGHTLKEIAERRSRSLNTVKTQLRAILRKTGVRSQGQLLCMVTALAHVAEDAGARPDPLRLRGNVALREVTLPGGGLQKYVEIGDKDGRPVLLIAPTNRPDFTPEVARPLADAGLRVICPVRPGSWGMPRWRKWDPAEAVHVYLSLLDRLAIDRAALAGLRTGGSYAINLARAAPGRFSGLVLVETGAPLDAMSRLVAMPPWPRTLYTTARLYPELLQLPFRYCASDFWGSAAGERRAIEAFFRDSPRDLELLHDRRFYEIARRNLGYCFEHPDQIARDIGHWVRDWTRDLVEVGRRTPVRFVHGSEQPGFPAEDILAFCERHPQATARIVEGAGNFLVYQHPDVLGDELLSATRHASGRGALPPAPLQPAEAPRANPET